MQLKGFHGRHGIIINEPGCISFIEVILPRTKLPILIIALMAACVPTRPIPAQPAPTFSPTSRPVTSPVQEPGIKFPGVENPYSPHETDSSLQRDRVTLESKELLVQESHPPKYTLALRGTLPTPCHELRVAIEEPGVDHQINLEVYSVVDPNAVCIQIISKLDVKIDMNDYPSGKYSVWVNGEKVGEMEVPETSLAMKGYQCFVQANKLN